MTLPAERLPSPNEVARGMPHRRLVAGDNAHDERAETPFGAMYVVGAIDRRHYVAGIRYRRLVNAYRAAIASPRAAESIAGVHQVKRRYRDSAFCTELCEACLREGTACEIFEKIKLGYFAADQSLRDEAGHKAASVTRRVIIEEDGIPPGGYRPLLEGLKALAGHFRSLTSRPSG